MSPTSSSGPLAFQGVGKTFRARSARSLLWAVAGRAPLRTVQALHDVSLTLPRGGAVAVIGDNGAGKSTLLRLAVGASRPTAGCITREGTVAPVLELGAGFHPALSGRENAVVNAQLLGLPRAAAHEVLDGVLDFAELADVADVPVSDYSAGMLLRLGFAVAVHTDPALLVVDEVLAVGDLGFQLKCLARIRELREGGTSLLFASHVLGTVREVADEVLWLDRGQVVARGAAVDVVTAYEQKSHDQRPLLSHAARVHGRSDMEQVPAPGSRVRVDVVIEALQDLPAVQVEFRLRRLDLGVLAAWSGDELRLPPLARSASCRVETSFTLAVADGRHLLDLALLDAQTRQVLYEEPAVTVFDVPPRAAGRGIVDVSPESGVSDSDT